VGGNDRATPAIALSSSRRLRFALILALPALPRLGPRSHWDTRRCASRLGQQPKSTANAAHTQYFQQAPKQRQNQSENVLSPSTVYIGDFIFRDLPYLVCRWLFEVSAEHLYRRTDSIVVRRFRFHERTYTLIKRPFGPRVRRAQSGSFVRRGEPRSRARDCAAL